MNVVRLMQRKRKRNKPKTSQSCEQMPDEAVPLRAVKSSLVHTQLQSIYRGSLSSVTSVHPAWQGEKYSIVFSPQIGS